MFLFQINARIVMILWHNVYNVLIVHIACNVITYLIFIYFGIKLGVFKTVLYMIYVFNILFVILIYYKY